MDRFFSQTTCDRCGGSLSDGRTMSMYNEDCICMKCKDAERKRSDYKTAFDADLEAVKKGNYNFPGIGKNYKKCPKCESESFNVSAHVVQEWKVDHNGTFMGVVDDCLEVTHYPDDEDVWDCENCGYSATGEKFNVPAPK